MHHSYCGPSGRPCHPPPGGPLGRCLGVRCHSYFSNWNAGYFLFSFWMWVLGKFFRTSSRPAYRDLIQALSENSSHTFPTTSYKIPHIRRKESQERGITRGMRKCLGMMEMFIILIFWWWFHRCAYMSEPIRLYTFHMCSYFNKVVSKLKKKITPKGPRDQYLSQWEVLRYS